MTASGGNIRKSPYAAANEAGTRGRHGARPAQREKNGGRPESMGGKKSGVRGNDRGHEASRVAHKPPGVGDEEGGGMVSVVAENPQGSRQGLGAGVDFSQGTDTPKVIELPWGDKTHGGITAGRGVRRKN